MDLVAVDHPVGTVGGSGAGSAAAGSAAGGGAYFVVACVRLVYRPTVSEGWKTFAASIVQLGLLLTGAILDNLLLG